MTIVQNCRPPTATIIEFRTFQNLVALPNAPRLRAPESLKIKWPRYSTISVTSCEWDSLNHSC
jgi:hypothetical protein